ncbi:hypothetical protein [Prosthecobacter sp.]|uniref:hypothetical protein n=1 Tax=Prosthecobacter sp. TaxID=1965333 RepID=UPI003784AA51
MNKASLIASSFVILLSSCTTRLVDFTIISTKNVDLSHAASFKRHPKRATGTDAKKIIVLFPTGVPSPKQAVDRAIESVPGGVALVDGVLTRSFFYIPYIFGETKFVVEGTVLVDPSLAASFHASKPVDGNNIVVVMNRDGSVASKRSVTETEYAKITAQISKASGTRSTM